jgi:hypothetical protein
MNSIHSKLKAYKFDITSSFADSHSFQSNWKDGLRGKKKSLNRIIDIVLCKGTMPFDEEAYAHRKKTSNSAESNSSPFTFIDESTIATVTSDLTDIMEEEYDRGHYDSGSGTGSRCMKFGKRFDSYTACNGDSGHC